MEGLVVKVYLERPCFPFPWDLTADSRKKLEELGVKLVPEGADFAKEEASKEA